MGCIGSPNYLSLSPYKIASSSQRITKSFTSHWFLIQVISSLIDLNTFGNSKQIYFSSENMVANGWFKMYLNDKQFNFLANSKYFKLYPIENKNKISRAKADDESGFYVHASKEWTPPPGSRIISRLSDTLFYVDNLQINEALLNDRRILKIQPGGIKESLNRFVAGFLQSGHQKSVYSNNIYAPIRPLHELGLNGSKQIINVVDSGIDIFNAFFYDPDPKNDLLSITGRTNVNHRKVVRIEPIVDNTDEEKGHGTHVSGTACGSSYCSECGISQYNGIAPESKLYFSDIGNSTTGDLSGTVDLEEQSKIFRELGVHVSSNSWGYSYNNKEIEFSYNKAAFEHPEILYVFAAGNSQNYNTINCPGNSKNVLSVSSASFVSSAYLYFNQKKIEILDENQVVIHGKEMTDSFIFWRSVDEKMKYYLNLTLKPFVEDADTDFYKDSVVVLNNETGFDDVICERTQKVESLGAAAIIFITEETEFYCDETRPTIPMINLVSKENISSLFDMKKVSLLPYSGTEKKIPSADYFSSKGPADSGLRKPDIIIPGSNIYSAKSHGPSLEDVDINSDYDDNICLMSGSSMATPQASALSLLILQYLNEGFYPSLVRNSANSINNISSCLLKALLVNTAIKPDSEINESKSLPRKDVGFGTPFLHKILGFNDTGLRFVDNEKIGQKSHVVYKIKLDSNLADLSVTLVYLDPPLDVDNEALLFADLDLYVKSPKGQILNGNNVSDGDTLTLIERVVFDKGEIPENGGEFEIHVVSGKFPIDSQKVMYSIVVNGPFDMKNVDLNPLFLRGEKASENDCPNDCNGNGKCENSLCVCNDGFVGLACGTEIKQLNDGSSDQTTLNYGDLMYFRIPLKENVEKIDFDIIKSVRSGNVYFCTSFDESPGKLTDSGWTCNLACPKVDQDSEIDPLFANYSFETPKTEIRPKFFNLAFYTGYYKAETITVDKVRLTFSEKPSETSSPLTKSESESQPLSPSSSSSSPVSQSESISVSLSPTISQSEKVIENEDEDDKLPIFVYVILALVAVMVTISIALVPILMCKRKPKEDKLTSGMTLFSNQDI